MKTLVFAPLKQMLRDRLMAAIIAAMLLLGVSYALYVGLSLQPSDLQVATRYTSFGSTHFYRDRWYYLISFIIFAFVVIGVHTLLALKLYVKGQRRLAIFLGFLSLFIVIIALITARSVLRIAFL